MFSKNFNKKKFIIFTAIIIFIFSTFFTIIILNKIYLFHKLDTVPTFVSTTESSNYLIDLNGDGKKDVLYISSSKDNYSVSCNINDKVYSFDVKSPINTLGFATDYWPISIKFIDLSRDKIPEIIIQSNENNVAIFHLFKWTGNRFKDLYCSTHEIFGILDSGNNKTPKLLSFSLNDSIEDVEKNMIINNNIKNISYEKIDIFGLESIKEFIELITISYNLYDLPDIFSENLNYDALKTIDQLDKENYFYIFQDSIFNDESWDSKGNVETMNWNLRFRKVSKKDEKDSKLIEWKLSLKRENSRFKINKIIEEAF
ncbi:MAG: FG-GAP repeat domain-containing protein [Sarcina sp.]